MLRVRDLGRVPYREADDLQRALARGRDDYVLLLEHPHVYTLGVRADPAHVRRDPASVGAELVQTDRGGDVTYHGPGQLVVYPVLTVPDDPAAGRLHVEWLERCVVAALGDLGLGTQVGGIGLLDGFPGVWVGVDQGQPRKVAAVGVRTLRVCDPMRRRTIHGVALNVAPELSMFDHIVPCGISEYPVTSLAAEGCQVERVAVVDALVTRIAEGRPGSLDRASVHGTPGGRGQVAPATAPSQRAVGSEPSSFRRLRRAGVEPEAGIPIHQRKPPWVRVPVRIGTGYRTLEHTVRDLGLVTVCEEAGCPNIYECWADGTATFMINGDRCTRSCGFCLVDTSRPFPLDPEEPARVAEAVSRMGLAHAVVTCVARDDLPDDGAGAMAETVAAIRARCPQTAVEVLISDCRGHRPSLQQIFDACPDVLNHNMETVARLQSAVRPSAGYARSLSVLAAAAAAGLVTKSGFMVGLGETPGEVRSLMADLANVGVSIVTVGQYLRPTARHLPVASWWSPEELAALVGLGLDLGIAHVEASPLTRSSYHARRAHEAARMGAVPAGLTGGPAG